MRLRFIPFISINIQKKIPHPTTLSPTSNHLISKSTIFSEEPQTQAELSTKYGASCLLKQRRDALQSAFSHSQNDQSPQTKIHIFYTEILETFPLTQRCCAFGIALYAKSIKTVLSHDCPKIHRHALAQLSVKLRRSP